MNETDFAAALQKFFAGDNFHVRSAVVPVDARAGMLDEESVRHAAVSCAAQLAGDPLPLQNALEQCYIDSYSSGLLSGYAAALWLMRFDEDNWFSFETAHNAAAAWFAAEAKWLERRELHMMCGVSTGLVFPDMCKAPALPLLVDYRLQRAELVAVGLAD